MTCGWGGGDFKEEKSEWWQSSSKKVRTKSRAVILVTCWQHRDASSVARWPSLDGECVFFMTTWSGFPWGVLPTCSVFSVWPEFPRFSYLYFLTNICPLVNRKHGIHLEDHDSGGDGSFWVLIVCCHCFWCYRPKVKHAGRILRLSHSHARVLPSVAFRYDNKRRLSVQWDRPQNYKWHRFKCLVQHCRGRTDDFSELRRSPVYLLITKKEECVSQNMALWAKAVFLCSLEQPSVALHLRPIILHRFSETDKTCKMSNDTKTAYHSAVYFVSCICIWFWCASTGLGGSHYSDKIS